MLRVSKSEKNDSTEMNYCSLTCEKHIDIALFCLASFLKNMEGVRQLKIYDDGSLTESSLDSLLKLGSQVRVVTLGERDEGVREQLVRYPHCQKYRDEQVFGYKLFDVPLDSDSYINYVDADIVFLRKTALNVGEDQAYGLREDRHGYSSDVYSLFKVLGAMPDGLCAGMLRLPKKYYDLDKIEYWLSRAELWKCPRLLEQTIFAKIIYDSGGKYISFNQLPSSCRSDRILATMSRSERVGVHLIWNLKDNWRLFNTTTENHECRELELVKMRHLSLPTLVLRKCLGGWPLV